MKSPREPQRRHHEREEERDHLLIYHLVEESDELKEETSPKKRTHGEYSWSTLTIEENKRRVFFD